MRKLLWRGVLLAPALVFTSCASWREVEPPNAAQPVLSERHLRVTRFNGPKVELAYATWNADSVIGSKAGNMIRFASSDVRRGKVTGFDLVLTAFALVGSGAALLALVGIVYLTQSHDRIVQ